MVKIDTMLNKERDLVTRLLKQNIVTLCKETVSYDTQLEIDGIICISAGNESQQIVVKVHHFFQKLNQGAKTQNYGNAIENGLSDGNQQHDSWGEVKRYHIAHGQNQGGGRARNEHFQNELQTFKSDFKTNIEHSSSESMVLPTIVDTSSKFNSHVGERWQNGNNNNIQQIPKTIKSLDQDESSLIESEKLASNESCSGSDIMDLDETCAGEERKDNSNNHQMVSLRENGDVIPEMSGQSPVKVFPESIISSAFESKQSRKNASPDENSMIECKLGKNCNTEEDLSKVPIRQIRDIQCKRCGVILKDGTEFEQHNTEVHSVYTCRVCFNTFTCRNNMKRHMRLHTGFRPYTCKLCSESFTRKDDIKRHLIRHSFDKPFRCNVCRKGYMDRKTVKNHIRKEHNSKVIHICQTCGETFDNSAKFHDHKKNHPELKMFQCSLCKFTGSNMLTHNKHQLIHEVKKDYRCDPCDLIFGDPFRYTTHLRKHRTDPNFVSYRCCFCDLNLSNYELFLRHEHTHDQSEQFTCYVCMKQFQSEAAMKDHKRSHPVFNNQTDPSSSQVLPNIVGAPIMVQQPIFPSFLSSLSPVIKPEQPSSYLDESHGNKSFKSVENGINIDSMDDIESILKYKNDKMKIKVEEPNFESTENEQNDYWCAECQHGFATEDHLTEHIALAHENTVYPDVEPDWNKQDNNIHSHKIENCESVIRSNNEEFEMSGNDDSFDELEENDSFDNSNCSPGSIRYTPVPIFNSKHNPKRPYGRQESKYADNSNNTSPMSTNSIQESNEPDLDRSHEIQEYCESSKMESGFEKIEGKKNYHAQSQFMCDICFMNFSEFESFDLHSSSVHRKFVCHFCGKGFTSRPNRDRHVRYHTGEKPFKCEVCLQSFVRGDDLRYHRTSKHPDVKPYTCNICGMSFPWAKDLERHTKTHGIG